MGAMKCTVGPKPDRTDHTTRREVVWSAFIFAPFGTVFALFFGQGLASAAFYGITAAMIGLAGWFIYHLISHRSNWADLVYIPFTSVGVLGDLKRPLWGLMLTLAFAVFSIAFVLGIWSRIAETRKPRSKPIDPLFDGEIDQVPLSH
jgi:hypothetical protein